MGDFLFEYLERRMKWIFRKFSSKLSTSIVYGFQTNLNHFFLCAYADCPGLIGIWIETTCISTYILKCSVIFSTIDESQTQREHREIKRSTLDVREILPIFIALKQLLLSKIFYDRISIIRTIAYLIEDDVFIGYL